MFRADRLGIFIAIFSIAGCSNRVVSDSISNQPEKVIPFTLNDQNNIVVDARLNNTDSLKMMLHTAASDVTLTEEATRKLTTFKPSAKTSVKSWGGEAQSRFSKGNRLQIGDIRRDEVDIWENKNSGKDTDGKFGLNFFGNQIIEIDFDHFRIILRDQLPLGMERYERIRIENQDGQLFIPGNCTIDGKNYSNKFLIHTGYAGGILLDDDFTAKVGLDGKIKITEESALKDSFGNTIKVKKGILPEFAIGTAKILNVPAGYFSGAVGNQKMSVIGCEVLRRFNLIFDIANKDVYLMRRQL